jgi:tripartite-type tricarboxylate transporter receptor subunit TctC
MISRTRRGFLGGALAAAGSRVLCSAGLCSAGLGTAGLGTAGLGLPAHAATEPYPTRPISIVGPFAAGSVSDGVARVLANRMQTEFGVSCIVENKVGGGGLLASQTVARSNPDGYTLQLTASSVFSGAALYKSLPFDVLKDFTHIARIGGFPCFIAVHPSLPVRSMTELVAYAKANPGKLSYGHGNNMGQIVGETLKRRTGIEIVRVAYRSNPAAVTDLVAGHIQIMIPDFLTGLAQAKAGHIRPLAVFTKTQNPALPGVPTCDETVMPGFELLPWCGLSGPANLPPGIVTRLARTVEAALVEPDVRERFTNVGCEVFWGGPQEFQAYIARELANWTALVKEAGIQPE